MMVGMITQMKEETRQRRSKDDRREGWRHTREEIVKYRVHSLTSCQNSNEIETACLWLSRCAPPVARDEGTIKDSRRTKLKSFEGEKEKEAPVIMWSCDCPKIGKYNRAGGWTVSKTGWTRMVLFKTFLNKTARRRRILTKALPTDWRTDERTDQRTNGPLIEIRECI